MFGVEILDDIGVPVLDIGEQTDDHGAAPGRRAADGCDRLIFTWRAAGYDDQ